MNRGVGTAATIALIVALSTVQFVAVEESGPPLPRPEAMHQSIPDPIEIELEVDRAPRLDDWVTLTATLEATWFDLKDTNVTLTLPEGIASVSPTELSLDLIEGQSIVVPYLLRIMNNGTHRVTVYASASVPGGTLGGQERGYLDVPPSGEGAFRLNQKSAPKWGGYAALLDIETPPIEAEEDNGGWVPGPDVGTPLPAPPSDFNESGTSTSSTGVGDASPTFRVRACWNYLTVGEGAERFVRDQRWATWQVWDRDSGGAIDPHELLDEGVTGEDGCFLSDPISRTETDCCLKGNQNVFLRFHASNAHVRVITPEGDTYFWETKTKEVGNEDTMDWGQVWPADNDFAARPFQFINNGADFAINRGPFTSSELTQVRAIIPDPDNRLAYDRSSDTILLRSPSDPDEPPDPKDADQSPDDVLHEYGHYIMDKAYGDSFWPPRAGGQHFLCRGLDAKPVLKTPLH